MSRRRIKSGAISLFSFQDVMASIIGFLFFIVLIVALNITSQEPASVPPELSQAYLEQLQSQQAGLQTRLAQSQDELLALTRDMNLAGMGAELLAARVGEGRQSLGAMIQSIKQDMDTVQVMSQASRDEHKQGQELADQLAVLQAKTAAYEQMIQEVKDNPPVSFIVDDLCTLIPILVEITDRRLVVSDLKQTCRLEYAEPDVNGRVGRFWEWAGAQDAGIYYFVFYIKPSGIEISNIIIQKLLRNSTKFGVDLIPENDRIL